MRLFSALLCSAAVACASCQLSPHQSTAMGINLQRLRQRATDRDHPTPLVLQDSNVIFNPEDYANKPTFQPQYFEQKLDHVGNDTRTFQQRFWVNSRHYTPGTGGPIFVLDGGETSGVDRIPFLDTGIMEILARATGGIGVVLEHRYYGTSIPVKDFSTDSMRWLDNAQSAADSANFIRNAKFEGISDDISPAKAPWIYYGGSYAGARAAHMRVLYPDIVFGAIASSGVTHATLQNWEYMDIIRMAADPTCMSHLQNSIETIDTLLSNAVSRKLIKSLFGMGDLEHDDDFAGVLESPLGLWQAKVWDPEVGSVAFDEFCETINKPPIGRFTAQNLAELPYDHPERLVHSAGLTLDFSVINYANWIKENIVSFCEEDETTEECLGTYDDEAFQGTSLRETWRAWIWQVCTEWGYFSTAPPDQSYPRIVSHLLQLDYSSKICHQAFPPGKHASVPPLPNVTAVNTLGDFDIAADRLAIIDGEVDPWRPATPHSRYAKDREDTLLRPFKLIPNAVHHYDEYGLRRIEDEPPEIRKIHGEMIAFVLEWLKDWNATTST